MTRFRAALAGAAVLVALPATAQAGTVTHTTNDPLITYAASSGGDTVDISTDGNATAIRSAGVVFNGIGDCTQNQDEVRCLSGTTLQVNLLAGNENNVNASMITSAVKLQTQ